MSTYTHADLEARREVLRRREARLDHAYYVNIDVIYEMEREHAHPHNLELRYYRDERLSRLLRRVRSEMDYLDATNTFEGPLN